MIRWRGSRRRRSHSTRSPATRWSSSTRRTTCPTARVLAVTGDITFEQAKAKAEAAFGGWKKSGAAPAG